MNLSDLRDRLRLIRILMCWEGREKEITFVEVAIDNGPGSSFSVWKQQR